MIWVVVCFYNMFWFFFQVGGPNVIVTLSCVCVIALIIYLDFLSISAFSVGKTVKPLIIRSWIGPRGPVLTVIWSNCHVQFPCILFKFQNKKWLKVPWRAAWIWRSVFTFLVILLWKILLLYSQVFYYILAEKWNLRPHSFEWMKVSQNQELVNPSYHFSFSVSLLCPIFAPLITLTFSWGLYSPSLSSLLWLPAPFSSRSMLPSLLLYCLFSIHSLILFPLSSFHPLWSFSLFHIFFPLNSQNIGCLLSHLFVSPSLHISSLFWFSTLKLFLL